jgi:hypothetical protein
MAVIHYLHNRMTIYKLLSDSMQKQNNTIQQILTNNKKQNQDIERTKWAKFTYIGRETKFVTNIFKNTNVKVTFTTDNATENYLTFKNRASYL